MKRFFTAVATIAAITTTPAFAASSASASLGNFQVTLTDLDLTDGITPMLTWLNAGNSYNNGYANDPLNSNYLDINQTAAGDFAPLSNSVATALSLASAAVTGLNTFNAVGFQANGSAQSDGASYYGNVYSYGSFNLSANTQANFSAAASTQATTTVGFDGVDTESAHAESILQTYIYNFGYGSLDYIQSTATYNYDPITLLYIGQSASDARLLSVSISNLTSADVNGYLLGEADVNGLSNIQAVPEPESYAMLLAGIGMIGFITRGKKNQHA